MHGVLNSIHFQKQQCPQQMGNGPPRGQGILNLIQHMNRHVRGHTKHALKAFPKSPQSLTLALPMMVRADSRKSWAVTMDFNPWQK